MDADTLLMVVPLSCTGAPSPGTPFWDPVAPHVGQQSRGTWHMHHMTSTAVHVLKMADAFISLVSKQAGNECTVRFSLAACVSEHVL